MKSVLNVHSNVNKPTARLLYNYLNSLITMMFGRIKVLQSLMNVRHKGVKLVQIESELISRAERMKKLHFENKHLYGAKLRKKEEKAAMAAIETVIGDVKHDTDISSEIYWTCLHVPEVQDFTKPKRKKKAKTKETVNVPVFDDPAVTEEPEEPEALPKRRPKKAAKKVALYLPEEEDEDPPVKKPTKKKGAKKIVEDSDDPPMEKSAKKIVIVPQLPYTLTQLSSAFPPAISNKKASSSYQNKHTDSDSDDSSDEQKIPFEKQQLRAITNFPLILKNDNTISPFKSFTKAKPSIYIPSVSKVLQSTMPENQRAALIQWKNLKITELGLEGFNVMQQSHLSRGKQFHQCLQSHFRNETIDMPSEVIEIWKSIEPLLENFQAPGVLVEEKVKHPYLLYQGVVDCVSFHNSALSVIEWKKSDRQKKSLNFTYDAPIQLCSYLGALNASKEEFRENPIKNGIVVVAYNDGQKADLFELNESHLKRYWKLWLHRLQEYWVRYRDNTLPDEI